MAIYDYFIIGGGMTAASAAQAIREVDPKGIIGMIGDEKQAPYDRPPLTKKLWQGKSEEQIRRKLPREAMELVLGRRVTALEPQKKRLQDDAGNTYEYHRLLLATGGSPRRLSFWPEDVLYYRTSRIVAMSFCEPRS